MCSPLGNNPCNTFVTARLYDRSCCLFIDLVSNNSATYKSFRDRESSMICVACSTCPSCNACLSISSDDALYRRISMSCKLSVCALGDKYRKNENKYNTKKRISAIERNVESYGSILFLGSL